MPERLSDEVVNAICALYRRTNGNANQSVKILRQIASISISATTVIKYWRERKYKIGKQGGNRGGGARNGDTTQKMSREKLSAILRVYRETEKDAIKTVEELAKQGYKVTLKVITACYVIDSAYDRYDGSATLAAKNMPYSRGRIRALWKTGGRGIKNLEERL